MGVARGTTRTIRAALGSILTLALFIIASLGAAYYAEVLLESDMLMGPLGMAQYVIITVIAVVVAPISTVPLIPVASMLWGPIVAALLSILGWVVGAQIAFELARSAFRPFVLRFITLERAERYAHVVMGERPFWTLLLLRMCIPVDVLSYAVGLCVPMHRLSYILATLIGVSPFAFVFAHAAELPLTYQLITLMGVVIAATLGSMRIARVARG